MDRKYWKQQLQEVDSELVEIQAGRYANGQDEPTDRELELLALRDQFANSKFDTKFIRRAIAYSCYEYIFTEVR